MSDKGIDVAARELAIDRTTCNGLSAAAVATIDDARNLSRLLKNSLLGGFFPLPLWDIRYSGMISGFFRDRVMA